ncbi:uncharacterized protein LOC130158629 isoform X2 [Falco biarmicus]|uniref:uncharacterized protein LOC130158629 isoform X2 n=1 Tax=Falco biarmicus TaxID=345155 RepID=UPI0024BC57BF|nr:uncharacterized protein LOC130158629 isoform X2 [Falco biarmicus]
MSPALSLLLSLASCTLLWGMPLPPRDVRLEAQNFHVHLRWEPDPGSPSSATYQVEWRRRTSPWTKADTCGGNSTGSSWACELYFDKIHDIYWARVRAVAGGKLSKWASSSELQLYRDSGKSAKSPDQEERDGNRAAGEGLDEEQGDRGGDTVSNCRPPQAVLAAPGSHPHRALQTEQGGSTVHLQVPEAQHTVLHPDSSRGHGQGAEQGGRAVPSDSGRPRRLSLGPPCCAEWCLPAAGCGRALVHPTAHLPQPLRDAPTKNTWIACISEQALPNKELNVPIRVSTPELEEDSLTLLLQTLLPSHVLPAAQHAAPTVQLLVGESISQGTSGYCANGFGPDCHEGRDTSCTHSQPGHADASQVGEVSIGGELEQPMPVELTRDSYTGDRDYGTSETWLSLHSQFSSKCQCPALEAGSCLPLPTPGRGFSQEDLRESLGIAGHWVPLSSVKLPASEEEDGGQLVCALQPLHGHGTGDSTAQPGNLEQAALDVPLPRPYELPQLPPDVLQAAPFSGYEPHPPADGEP